MIAFNLRFKLRRLSSVTAIYTKLAAILFLPFCFFLFFTSQQQTQKQIVMKSLQKDLAHVDVPSDIRQKGYVHNLANADVYNLTTDEMVATLDNYMHSVNVSCDKKVRLGNLVDGGWEVCDDPDVTPRDPCIIYSFGINNDFSFEDEASKHFGCHVYSFDPSMTEVQDKFDRSEKVHFFKVGLDGRTHVNELMWSVLRFQDIRDQLDHLNVNIDVLRMDIGGSEWSAIPDMAQFGELTSVRQLLVEFHLGGEAYREKLLPKLSALQDIEKNGFKKFSVHKNDRSLDSSKYVNRKTISYKVHYLRQSL